MKNARWIYAAALLAAILFVVLRASELGKPLDYEGKIAEAGAQVAGALLVVVLFVERGMSVVNALIWGERQRQADIALAALGSLEPAALVSRQEEVRDALKEEAEVLSAKERLRLLLGFVAGLFISAAGVRTLSGLLVEEGAGEPFHVVDTVLTAALIAGGSNGLAYLINLLKQVANGKPETPEARLRASLTTTG